MPARCLILSLLAASGAAGSIQYTLVTSAITSGPVQAAGFSLTFVEPHFLAGPFPQSVTGNSSLVVTGSPDPLNPFTSATFFSYGGASIDFQIPATSTLRVSPTLPSYDQVGVYTVTYYVLRFLPGQPSASSTAGLATWTIADLGADTGAAPVPEPAVAGITAAGLTLLAWRRSQSACQERSKHP